MNGFLGVRLFLCSVSLRSNSTGAMSLRPAFGKKKRASAKLGESQPSIAYAAGMRPLHLGQERAVGLPIGTKTIYEPPQNNAPNNLDDVFFEHVVFGDSRYIDEGRLSPANLLRENTEPEDFVIFYLPAFDNSSRSWTSNSYKESTNEFRMNISGSVHPKGKKMSPWLHREVALICKYVPEPTDKPKFEDESTDDSSSEDESTDDSSSEDESTDDSSSEDKPTDGSEAENKPTDGSAAEDKSKIPKKDYKQLSSGDKAQFEEMSKFDSLPGSTRGFRFDGGSSDSDGTYDSSSEDETADGSEAEDESADGSEADDKPTDGSEAEDESNDGPEAEDKPTDGSEAEDESNDGPEVEDESNDGSEAEDESNDESEAEDESNDESEAEDESKSQKKDYKRLSSGDKAQFEAMSNFDSLPDDTRGFRFDGGSSDSEGTYDSPSEEEDSDNSDEEISLYVSSGPEQNDSKNRDREVSKVSDGSDGSNAELFYGALLGPGVEGQRTKGSKIGDEGFIDAPSDALLYQNPQVGPRYGGWGKKRANRRNKRKKYGRGKRRPRNSLAAAVAASTDISIRPKTNGDIHDVTELLEIYKKEHPSLSRETSTFQVHYVLASIFLDAEAIETTEGNVGSGTVSGDRHNVNNPNYRLVEACDIIVNDIPGFPSEPLDASATRLGDRNMYYSIPTLDLVSGTLPYVASMVKLREGDIRLGMEGKLHEIVVSLSLNPIDLRPLLAEEPEPIAELMHYFQKRYRIEIGAQSDKRQVSDLSKNERAFAKQLANRDIVWESDSAFEKRNRTKSRPYEIFGKAIQGRGFHKVESRKNVDPQGHKSGAVGYRL